MALHFTKVHFVMHSAFATTGHQPICQECVCGAAFTTDHALSCPTGGITIIQHNEVRDLTASLLTKVCHDVCIEPRLQALLGETLSTRSATTEDNARLDVAASGFWGGRFGRAFFDVRILTPTPH